MDAFTLKHDVFKLDKLGVERLYFLLWLPSTFTGLEFFPSVKPWHGYMN